MISSSGVTATFNSSYAPTISNVGLDCSNLTFTEPDTQFNVSHTYLVTVFTYDEAGVFNTLTSVIPSCPVNSFRNLEQLSAPCVCKFGFTKSFTFLNAPYFPQTSGFCVPITKPAPPNNVAAQTIKNVRGVYHTIAVNFTLPDPYDNGGASLQRFVLRSSSGASSSVDSSAPVVLYINETLPDLLFTYTVFAENAGLVLSDASIESCPSNSQMTTNFAGFKNNCTNQTRVIKLVPRFVTAHSNDLGVPNSVVTIACDYNPIGFGGLGGNLDDDGIYA